MQNYATSRSRTTVLRMARHQLKTGPPCIPVVFVFKHVGFPLECSTNCSHCEVLPRTAAGMGPIEITTCRGVLSVWVLSGRDLCSTGGIFALCTHCVLLLD